MIKKLYFIFFLLITFTVDAYSILIDVRTREEWDAGFIEGATHIPLNNLALEINKYVINDKEEILLYCRSGNRSGKAKLLLNSLGYTNVKNLGGINDISQRLDLSIIKPNLLFGSVDDHLNLVFSSYSKNFVENFYGNILNLKRIGDVPKKVVSKDDRKVTEITIVSKNTNDDITLVNNEGKNQKVRVELRNLESISNGLIIVVPSSTPNMDDELYYEKQISKHGYATAIVYGAEPRYQKKFTGSYTSSMILYDALATIDEVSKQFGKPKEVILIGSSTGSLAIFKAGWQDLRDKYPSMNLITKGFMINAACPDVSEVKYSNKIQMYAINGQQDESTPPWVCKNLKDSSKNPNLYLLNYSGGHHFESRMYPPSKYDVESMHALPTCSLNYTSNLHQIIKRRDGTKEWNGEKQGYKQDQKKWFGKNCIDKGTLQGYEEYGAKQFWDDVKSVLVNKKDAKSLKGYTE